jgi:Flp pilus assembly protein TadB
MKVPFWLYALGFALAAYLGRSIHKEKQIKDALKRAKAAEEEAQAAQHEANRKEHQRERIRLEAQLAKERRRPVADRVADSYREYERKRAAAAKG